MMPKSFAVPIALALLLSLPLVAAEAQLMTTGAGPGSSGGAPGIAAMRSQQFVNSIGVNTHLPFSSTAYNNISSVLADLSFLGVTTIHDWWLDPLRANQANYDTAAAAGIKFAMEFEGAAYSGGLCGSPSATLLAASFALMDTFVGNHPGSILFTEGPNEINNFPVCYLNSAVTNGATASGNPTLHFAATLPSVVAVNAASFRGPVGSQMVTTDTTTPSAIPAATATSGTTGTTVTMTANATGAGVGSGDTIQFKADSNLAAGIAYQQDVYNLTHNDANLTGVKVIFFTDNPEQGGAGQADFWNSHPYPTSGVQPYQYFQNEILSIPLLYPGGIKLITTENGYYTTPDHGNGVDQLTQARGVLNILLDAFFAGDPYTYLYELLDESAGGGGFGLFDSTHTAKTAATAIHNLTTLLADAGGTALTFTPTRLNYTVSNLPTPRTGSPFLSIDNTVNQGGWSMLFQKSNGQFYIAVWNEPPMWNAAANADITITPISCTVSLGQTITTVNVYDPIAGASPIATASGVSSVNISLGGNPLIVEVIP